MSAMNNGEFVAQTEKIEQLVQRVNGLADPDARTTALELLQSLMDLHGAALGRIVEIANDSGERGQKLLEKLGADPLVCGLLVLYGIHPLDCETRIRRAVDNVAPALRKKGGSVELLGVADNVVRVRIEASGHGCGSSPEALEELVEQAIVSAAPEVTQIVAEGIPAATTGFVPLNQVQPATKEEKTYEESAA
jgi:Fe-S cluster biogenesis protein NfuA